MEKVQTEKPYLLPKELRNLRWVWSLGGLTIAGLARRTFNALMREDIFGRAAELSFYFVLALFPFLICVSTIIGMVFSDLALYERVLGYAQNVMPPSAYGIMRASLDELREGAGGGRLSLALVFALWTASLGVDSAIKALNVAYGIREFRDWWKRRLVAIAITILMLVLLNIALVAIIAGQLIRRWLAVTVSEFFLDPAWLIVQWSVVLFFMLTALSVTYLFGPNLKDQRWRAILPGSLVALACWVAASLGFRLYLEYFDSYSRTYGSLGAVIVLLFWLYLSGVALLIGGLVNAEIRHAAAEAGSREAQKITENVED